MKSTTVFLLALWCIVQVQGLRLPIEDAPENPLATRPKKFNSSVTANTKLEAALEKYKVAALELEAVLNETARKEVFTTDWSENDYDSDSIEGMDWWSLKYDYDFGNSKPGKNVDGSSDDQHNLENAGTKVASNVSDLFKDFDSIVNKNSKDAKPIAMEDVDDISDLSESYEDW